ncbi:MAG: class I SAM-dependent methyltransferase [Alphaproteobacteria bacterium]|nr:class I SAM-dependent methyltransferase [Alphaproteobacteria bacterium]
MADSDTNEGWSEDDSRHFIDYGAYFVPERETQIDTICSVIPCPQENSLIVDVCCGEGLLAAALARRFSQCHILALDGSSAMLEAAGRRLGEPGASGTTSLMHIADSGWLHRVVACRPPPRWTGKGLSVQGSRGCPCTRRRDRHL